MFGSTRFMAPEEFVRGALIDQRTSVFTMGRTALFLLSDGTATAFRGSLQLLQVAVHACRERPDWRHQSLAQFYAAWRDARAAPDGQPFRGQDEPL